MIGREQVRMHLLSLVLVGDGGGRREQAPALRGFARSPSVIFFENATSLPEGGLETGDARGTAGDAAGVG